MDTVQDSAENNDTDVNTELVRYYLDCMEECDEVSAPEICVFSGTKAKLTAYDYNDEAESLDLFLFIHATPLASRVDTRVRTGFNYLREFYNQSIKKKSPFYGSESEFTSEVQDAINIIRESKGKVNMIRFYLLTDGAVSCNEIHTLNEDEDGVLYEYHVWDIASIYRQDQIKQGNNKIEIDFENDIKYYVTNKNSQNKEQIAPKIQCLKVEDDNPSVDTYSKNININFVKFLRFLCFFVTLFLPGFYIALISYNQGSIPLNLLINFAMQRSSVPIPSIVECLVILTLCAILRESDIRFPTNYGSSISIMGALVMGDAAVSAGIVSPIMIIVVAVTYITSMVFTDVELINSFRHIRFLTIFLVSILGLFGFYMAIFTTLIHLCSLTSLDRPYTYPLAPFDKVYFNKTVFRSTKKSDKYRSRLLSRKNIRKEGD